MTKLERPSFFATFSFSTWARSMLLPAAHTALSSLSRIASLISCIFPSSPDICPCFFPRKVPDLPFSLAFYDGVRSLGMTLYHTSSQIPRLFFPACLSTPSFFMPAFAITRPDLALRISWQAATRFMCASSMR